MPVTRDTDIGLVILDWLTHASAAAGQRRADSRRGHAARRPLHADVSAHPEAGFNPVSVQRCLVQLRTSTGTLRGLRHLPAWHLALFAWIVVLVIDRPGAPNTHRAGVVGLTSRRSRDSNNISHPLWRR
jgi:hypothetical protein